MQKYLLPSNNLYGNTPVELEFPDDWDINVCSYKGEKAPKLSYQEIYNRIASPDDGTPSVLEGAREKKDAVIIIDDITRPTPCEEICKALIAQLEMAGVPRNKIRFVIALGGHRAMSREEFVLKLGEDIVSEFPIFNHNPFFNCVNVGESSAGFPLELNAECVAADYKIGVGALFAHPPTGVGGGPKLIMPGICSLNTIVGFHTTPGKDIQWDLNAKGRKLACEACEVLGLDLKIDVLLNGKGEIANLYSGHYDKNTRNHLDEIKDFFTAHHAGMADLVIINNYFKPSEISNVLQSGTRAVDMVRTNGDMVVCSNTPQGVAEHYVFGWWGDSGVTGKIFRRKSMAPHVGHCYMFTSYPNPGHNYAWAPQVENVSWHRTWSDILARLGPQKRKVVIIPYALVNWFDPPFIRSEECFTKE